MLSSILAIFDPDADTADVIWGLAFLVFVVVGIISISISRPAKFGWLQGVAWIATGMIALGLMFLI